MKMKLFAVVLFAVGASGCSTACRAAHDAKEVAYENYDPRAAMERYKWFKDAAAALDKKRADVKVYETRIQTLKEDYGSTPRVKWAREDREQFSIWQSEVAGIKASYNQLAAEYNAQMANIAYAYANRGQLPASNLDPLPREFKPYIVE